MGHILKREVQGTENQSPVISPNTICHVCVTEIEMFAEKRGNEQTKKQSPVALWLIEGTSLHCPSHIVTVVIHISNWL